jgi:pterin-4a-carbinolamine dehydratase
MIFTKPSLMAAEDLSEFIAKLKSLNPWTFKFNENEIRLRIKFEGFLQSQAIPLGFPTKEKID